MKRHHFILVFLFAISLSTVAVAAPAQDPAPPAQTPVNDQFVTVTGPVRQPGKVPWNPDLTVLDAIWRCGGFSGFREPRRIYLIRGSERIVILTDTLFANPKLNPLLKPNDTIELPKSHVQNY